MNSGKLNYISFEDFVIISGVKESTVKRRYRQIPGIIKTQDGFNVLSGTRYPCDIHRYKINDSRRKRYVLLKTISEYKYISHSDLKIEQRQFEDMLRDLLAAGLIQENNLCNTYGANAYDCTPIGDVVLNKSEREAVIEITNLIAGAAGTFVGSVVSVSNK